MPLLLVCEDNGLGISVRTPAGWIRAAYGQPTPLALVRGRRHRSRRRLRGRAAEAADWVRTERSPAFLHLRVVRYLAHAGTDVEAAYRSPAEIRDDYGRDPILATARLLTEAGVTTPTALVHHYERVRSEILALAEECATHDQLTTAEAVMAPLAPRHAGEGRCRKQPPPRSPIAASSMFGGTRARGRGSADARAGDQPGPRRPPRPLPRAARLRRGRRRPRAGSTA